ncbi:MAG: hypothetical protein U9O78_01520 [Patescibacteria group bacterium]|nr:hypothetical protein [Patescibacteria group bacterium]
MFLNLFTFLIILLNFLNCNTVTPVLAQAQKNVEIHIFTSKSCPHCAAEEDFLEQYVNQTPGVVAYNYEIENRHNSLLLDLIGQEVDERANGVPFTLIGNAVIIGYNNASGIGQEIKELVEQESRQSDWVNVGQLARENNLVPVRQQIGEPNLIIQAKPTTATPASNSTKPTIKEDNKPAVNNGEVGEKQVANTTNQNEDNAVAELERLKKREINLPILGTKQVKDFSLPVLTFVVAFLDGFNPCAMWTLMFLISLLLGLKDKKRMWILGSSFIIASGLVYFLFMSAWLNLFLFIGLLNWVRFFIGAVALVAGGYYLYDYVVNKTGACKVSMGGRKQRVFDKLKEFTYKKSLLVAVIGIIFLAFAVNLVELVCSAGLPAVYTKVLSMSNLSVWKYYLYLAVYIVIFMFDDLLIFFIAMTTLHKAGINTKYSRYSHLIGGILMLFIGFAMWFKPELLTFNQ